MHLCPFPDSNHRQSRSISPLKVTHPAALRERRHWMPWVDGWIQYLPFLKTNMAPKTLGFGRWIPFWGPASWQVLCFFGSVIKTYEIIVVLTGIDRVGSIPKHGWIFDWSARLGPCGIKCKPKTFLAAFPFKCETTLFLMHYIHTYCAALSNCFFNFVYAYIHIYIYFDRHIFFLNLGIFFIYTLLRSLLNFLVSFLVTLFRPSAQAEGLSAEAAGDLSRRFINIDKALGGLSISQTTMCIFCGWCCYGDDLNQ